MTYKANEHRYDRMQYYNSGNSGLKLPRISLGLWHNFGGVDSFGNMRSILRFAFDSGITHFDLANNYGPPPGSAENNFGEIIRKDFAGHRDEIIVSTKAGYYMWPGPYGDHGSRKHLISSIDQSLKRMRVEYVDIFYHHRPDPKTPLEETMKALADIIHRGKALYAGISNYSALETEEAASILSSYGVNLLIHQPRYSMFDRWVEDSLLDILEGKGIGCIPFSPLAQGLLTNRYLNGIPPNSRAGKYHGFLKKEHITPEKLEKVKKLNTLAHERGQSLAQLALAWILKDQRITSVLVGASSPEQIEDNLKALENLKFSKQELEQIDAILGS